MLFVSGKDIEELDKQGISYETDIKTFLSELRDLFNKIWEEKYYINREIKDIEELNSEYLENYPSTAGYYILESSFSGCSEIDMLSQNTKIILGYLYGIHLR
jgi:hypothetical protein